MNISFVFLYLCISDCIEIQQILQLLVQAKKSTEHPVTQDDNTRCEGLKSPKEMDDIALLLKENVDKLVKKLK